MGHSMSVPGSTAGERIHRSESSPGVSFLLTPGALAMRRRLSSSFHPLKALVLGAVGAGFWAVLFTILHRLLVYFRSADEIGDLLATKLLGLILLAFLFILLLSSVITALSSLFLARDLELLMAAPVDGVRLYLARLLETATHSSWMVGLVLVPILTAYGWVYDGGIGYLLVALATMAAYLTLPAVTGTAITLLLVNIFPARRARDLLALLGLLGVAGFVALIRLLRPEQLVSPDGFRNLVGFMEALRTPSSPWLPSEWAADALTGALGVGPSAGDLFPLLLLASTAAAAVVGGAALHQRWYREGFSRAQEGSEQVAKGTRRRSLLDRFVAPLPTTAGVLVAKEVRTFFRDSTQWSQLVLLGVLVVVYVYNVKALPLWSEEVSFFLANVISFLNLGLAGFVLAAIAARFIFPAVSLEGRTLWLLRSSPVDLRTLLWTKYWIGVLPLLAIALVLTFATNRVLEVGPFMMVLSLGTITVMTFAIASLAIGFGALFPRFDTTNAAEISTGFGGLLFMMTAVGYLGLVIVIEAWPVYAVLEARYRGVELAASQQFGLWLGLAAALALSAVVTVVPLRAAVRRVGELEG